MKRFSPSSARRVAAILAAIACALATGVLVADHYRSVTSAAEMRQARDQAEQRARQDPEASQALQTEIERQTNISLARVGRQKLAGAAALFAAGVCVALLKVGKPKKPALPAEIAASVTSRIATRQSVSCQSAESHTSDDRTCQAPFETRQVLTQHTEAPPVDLSLVDSAVEQVGRRQRDLIPLLHAMNERYNYLPPIALRRLSEITDISPDQVAGVASFYSQFRTRPRGKHLVQLCRGTACHIAGADRMLDELRGLLGVPPDNDTDPAGMATIETVGCLGCCTLAPVLQIDGRTAGHARIEDLPTLVDWDRPRENGANQTNGKEVARAAARAGLTSNGHAKRPGAAPLEIRIGLGSCCVAGGSQRVMDTMRRELARQRLDAVIKPVGCVGICHLTPLVEIVSPDSQPIVATRATPADVRRILRSLPCHAPWPSRLWNRLTDTWRRDGSLTKSESLKKSETPTNGASTCCELSPAGDDRIRGFLDPQVRIVTEHSGQMDPTSLEEYRRRDGFVALEQCLKQQRPETILGAIEQSGLRGRGGGGFPTGQKWRKASEAAAPKYLICNGDEGDPGAFMDRMVMESYPYRVLEGMAIAAYAIGAERAMLYVRHEYPLAASRVRHAIESMKKEGLLGENILDTGFSFEVEVVEGAGAFVCGEETALLQSIMGRRGTPRLRPPYPVEKGLWGRPTLVNNVETFACVPWIMRHGPEHFAVLGTPTSAGTKVFSLAGKVRRGGLIEIPMGLTIRDVVEHIGGGVADGRRFKAVQIGGPSGGCIPAELADTPIDFEALRQVGAIMGSGGLVVMDDTDCMVDVARYFLEFTQKESCGHCTFCRVGTRKLLDILERICAGKGHARDLKEIESLVGHISLGSLCGLGKTAPNPVLTTLRYFRDEYEAHLAGRCPAGRCKELIRYEVTRDCTGCTLCAQHCPVAAIAPTPYRQHVIDDALCTRCDVCRVTCPENAIRIV